MRQGRISGASIHIGQRRAVGHEVRADVGDGGGDTGRVGYIHLWQVDAAHLGR
jgi:hypothetical protein